MTRSTVLRIKAARPEPRFYDSGGDEFPPIDATLLSAIPAIVIMIAPAISAIWFGFRARRQGLRSGLIPAIVGIAAATITILTNTLPRIVGTWTDGSVGRSLPVRGPSRITPPRT